jgi:hypothetical protein
VVNGGAIVGVTGRYIEIRTTLARTPQTQVSPVLYDLTVNGLTNQDPVCTNAVASETELWPPNHEYHAIDVLGVTDPDGDPVTITVTGITQDEPTNNRGDGNTCPDAQIVNGHASVRAERTGTPSTPGNGRVYTISFTADDGNGGTCSDSVRVCVPHDRKNPTCIDDGQVYNSLGPCSVGLPVDAEVATLTVLEGGRTGARLRFTVPTDGEVNISIFDVTGRRVATIEDGWLAQGSYERSWNPTNAAQGLYFIRMRAGSVELRKTLLQLN